MPIIRTLHTHNRVKPYYPPLVYRARFAPEPLLNPPSRALRKAWPQDSSEALPPPSPGSTPTRGSSPESDTDDPIEGSIAKPQGEVTRKARGGYNLEEALGWEHEIYVVVQVCMSDSP